jgi:tagatose-1,6-bisphosphate aldolase
MKKLSPGKLRSFQQCTSQKGTFTCLALDHRQNLRKLNPVFEYNNSLSNFKIDVTRILANYSTSVLLDPEVSAGEAVVEGVMPGNKGLIVAVEETGYTGTKYSRKARILSGWEVEKAKRFGANMVKLLVYYHPESLAANEVEEIVGRIARDCQRYDIAFMLELLTYNPTGKTLKGDEKTNAVIHSARRLTQIEGVDLLKAELPLDGNENDKGKIANACQELSDSITIPWILLSASVTFEKFLEQAEIACSAGASGVAVGRAVWQETINMEKQDRITFLNSVGKERMSLLSSLCFEKARPWTDFYYGEVVFGWYKDYSGF